MPQFKFVLTRGSLKFEIEELLHPHAKKYTHCIKLHYRSRYFTYCVYPIQLINLRDALIKAFPLEDKP